MLVCNCTAKENCIQVINFCIHRQASCFISRIVLNIALLLRVVNESENVVVNQVVEEVNPLLRSGLISVEHLRNLTFPSIKANPGCI